MLDQAQFIRQFNETHREEFNPLLFERNNEEIVEAIRSVIESCQRDKYYTLKLLSFEAIYDYEEIYDTLREHEQKRKKKNSKEDNTYDFINIRDTDMSLIKINWLIRHNGIERIEDGGVTTEVVNPEEVMEVLIAVPRFTKKYYFRLSGNYYTTIFQIVDGSTYNNSTASQSKVDTVTMKTTFMPIRIFRSFNNMVDIISGEEMKLIEYQSIVFNNVCNVIYYLLAQFGLYGTAEFLQIKCISVADEPIMAGDYCCFEKNGIYISCPKICLQDPVVQSFVATLYDGIYKDTYGATTLYDQDYWIRNLGIAFKNPTKEKGIFVLDSIKGIYDGITRANLQLPLEDKDNVFCILRWLIREFSNLRIKENTNVRTKRIRIAEYVAAIYATRLNKGIYRMSDMGTRVTLKKVKQAIYTPPMYLMGQISTMSNLVSYRDMVNDLDSLTALKYTYKGISGLGEEGASIQPVYRYVDPSHIGILDMDASTSSDPGMSGMLCPMAQLYGPEKSFSEYQEPNGWRQEYFPIEQQAMQYKQGARKMVSFDNPPAPHDYSKRVEEISRDILDINRIKCPVSNIYDPTIRYTCSQTILKPEPEIEHKSLFTINPDAFTLN